MEEINLFDNSIIWRGKQYYFESIEKIDDQCIHITMKLDDSISYQSSQTVAFIVGQTLLNGQVKNSVEDFVAEFSI